MRTGTILELQFRPTGFLSLFICLSLSTRQIAKLKTASEEAEIKGTYLLSLDILCLSNSQKIKLLKTVESLKSLN